MFGFDQAISYIQSKLQDFYNKRFELSERYNEARALLQESYILGRMTSEAQENFQQAVQLKTDHNDLMDKLRPIASALSVDTGLGLAPALLTAITLIGGAATVIATATALYNWYQSNEVQKENQRLVREGLAPASVLEDKGVMGKVTDLLGNTTGLILAGAGAFLLWRMLR